MKHNPALDGLRAVAIIAVVIFHCGGGSGGYIGVDLFFVLSGFLITSLLTAEHEEAGAISLGRFYTRRWLRLGPPLLLMLAAWLVWAPFVWPGDNHLLSAFLASAYVADYAIPYIGEPRHLGHMWSLAIEEQFYLVWPLLLPLLLRCRKPVPILFAAFAVVTFWRWSFTDFAALYNRFDTHCSGLILGCALSFVRYRPSVAAIWTAAGGFVVLCLIAPPFYSGWTSFALTPAELIAFVLVAGAAFADHPLKTVLVSAPMVVIGRLSYGIYLWHVPIAWAVRDRLPFSMTLLIVSASSLAAAAISYFTIEALSRRVKAAAKLNVIRIGERANLAQGPRCFPADAPCARP